MQIEYSHILVYDYHTYISIVIVIVIVILFGGFLSSHLGTYIKFSLITIYGSNVPSKRFSC